MFKRINYYYVVVISIGVLFYIIRSNILSNTYYYVIDMALSGRLSNWTNIKMLESLKKWAYKKIKNDDIGSSIHLIFLLLYLMTTKSMENPFKKEGEQKTNHKPFRLGMQSATVAAKKPLRLGQRA